MNELELLRWKRTATFVFRGRIRNDDGTPLDIAAIPVTSQVRRRSNGVVCGTAVITKATQTGDDIGRYVGRFDSTAWPLDLLIWDVRCVVDGETRISPTVMIRVEPNATGDGS